MTIESTTSVVQFPLGPDVHPEMDGRLVDITVSFSPADMETLWQTAQERGCSLPELIQGAALLDAFR